MSRPDASAGPQTIQEPPLVISHASDPLHDPASHDDSIWSTNVTSYLKERVDLVPYSSSRSSSSLSTTSQSRKKTKTKTKSTGLGFSQLAEPYREDQVPSFRSAYLRPPDPPRTSSSPAMLTERPLSMSEIMSWRKEDRNEGYNPNEEDDKSLGQEADLGRDEDSYEGTQPRDEWCSHPENLAPGPLRVRGRCRSSPQAGPTDSSKMPFSSFIEIWR